VIATIVKRPTPHRPADSLDVFPVLYSEKHATLGAAIDELAKCLGPRE
jgi:hypothetical protein